MSQRRTPVTDIGQAGAGDREERESAGKETEFAWRGGSRKAPGGKHTPESQGWGWTGRCMCSRGRVNKVLGR